MTNVHPAHRTDEVKGVTDSTPHVAGGRPLISAIIPTHNRCEALRDAIDSALGQQERGVLFDLEVIVVDDASTDATRDVVAAYPNVRYIRHSTNLGAAKARNTGIFASHGQFVAFLDDDDVWFPHCMRTLLPALIATPEADIAYGPFAHELDGKPTPAPDRGDPSGDIFEDLLRLTVSCCYGRMLARRNAVVAVGGHELPVLEDLDLWLRMASTHRFTFVPADPIVVYRASSAGTYMRMYAAGELTSYYRRVVQRGLALRPSMPSRVKNAILDNMEILGLEHLRHASALSWPDRLDRALAALRAWPRLSRVPRARQVLALLAREFVLAEGPTLATAVALTRRIREACQPSFQVRRTLARVWREIAVGTFRKGERSMAAASLARAIVLDPTQTVAGLGARFAARPRRGT
ncbi:MAG TPA: glycosyltransferase family 2 protein [bacterium]|nr:glycosyltransferase family 2 protein [bacterium]